MVRRNDFCCKHFEHDYRAYNDHPNVRVVRLVSEYYISHDKKIKLPFRLFHTYSQELLKKNRMTFFVMTTGYRLFEFPNAMPKYDTLYKRIFYCPYCGKNLHKFYGPRIDEYVQEVEGDTFPLLSTRHEEYMKNDYLEQRMLGIYVCKIYTEWNRSKNKEDKHLSRVYIGLNLSYNSISCLEETVEIRENVKIPEKLVETEDGHTYWLQEEIIEWLKESPITKIRYLYEKKTGIKRGICLFFKNHHIVYYNPGYEYGDREVMLCDADLEAIMAEYGYILDK